MKNNEVRVGYDARFAIGQYRGMGKFLRQLISDHEGEFFGLCATGESDSSLNLVSKGFRFHPMWEQFSIPKRAVELNLDFLLAPYNTAPVWLPEKTRLILVIHDLIYLNPQERSISLRQNFGRAYRRLVVPNVIKDAALIVTVSEFSKNQIISQFSIEATKIQVIPPCIEDAWLSCLNVESSVDEYIFMNSGEAANKNLKRALRAYALYRRSGAGSKYRLKIAGVKKRFHPVFRSLASDLKITEFVDFLEYLSDDRLRALYKNASLFMMPSVAEGFGIPVLEAMACGVPIIASNVTCLPEVASSAAVYFNPYSIEDMASTIERVLKSPEIRERLSVSGIERAQSFRHSVVTKRVGQLWKQLL